MRKSYNRLIFVLFGGFFMLLAGLVSVFYLESYQTQEKENWVKHTNDIIYTTEKLLSYLKDAETGQRGFILTRDSSFLTPYFESSDSIWTNLARMSHLTQDNPTQQQTIRELESLVWERLSLLEGNLINAPDKPTPTFIVSLGQGKAKMDSIRKLVKLILFREKKLLALRVDEYAFYTSLSNFLLIGTYSIFFLFFVTCFIYARKLVKKQGEYEFALHDKNQELHAYNEELDALNEEMKSANEELSATNEEYLAANEELNEANDIIRYQSEKLVRQNEEKLNDVLNSINEIVSSTDVNTMEMLFINSACLPIIGYPQDAFYKDPLLWRKLMNPSDLEIVMEERSKIFEKGTIEVEYRLTRPDGRIIWLSSKSILKKDEHDRPIRIDTTSRDITKNKETLELLKESETKYKYLFEHNPLPYWVIDLETNMFLDVNTTALEMYGYHREEFLSLHASALGFIQEDKKEMARMQATKYENVPHHTIFTHIKKDGTHFYVEFFSERCMYNGRDARIALTVDISERKLAEKEKELLTSELVARNNDLEEFAYIISHNLRSPVANILGLISVINLPNASSDEKDFAIKKLQLAGKNLDSIVRDISIILSERDDKTGQKILSPVDFKVEIQNILESIEHMVTSCQATISSEFETAPSVNTVRSYFHNIAINLITNALKYYSPERKPVISIRSYTTDDFICLSVKDNGMGIDMKWSQNKIFKLYNRFHPHIEGKGMGLYLVKNQITALGGKIEVKSKLNVGTEFIVYFPLSNTTPLKGGHK